MEQQYLQRPNSRNLINRLFEPAQATPIKTSQEKGITVVSSKRDDSLKKFNLFSPQVQREYPLFPLQHQLPQRNENPQRP